jgi:hypothetical protein
LVFEFPVLYLKIARQQGWVVGEARDAAIGVLKYNQVEFARQPVIISVRPLHVREFPELGVGPTVVLPGAISKTNALNFAGLSGRTLWQARNLQFSVRRQWPVKQPM